MEDRGLLGSVSGPQQHSFTSACSTQLTSVAPRLQHAQLHHHHHHHRQQRQHRRYYAEPQDRDFIPPPPVPPPPPPPGQQAGYGYQQQQQQQQQFANATPKFQELGWRELKERYLRPTYLPASFTLGALTVGLRLGAANYTFTDSPLEYLGTAVSTGVMFMALAWVLFDFTDDPPSGGNFSSPRK